MPRQERARRGEFLGWRVRYDAAAGHTWWTEKRARVTESGAAPGRRTGHIEQTSNFMNIVKEATLAPGIHSFIFLPWPKYAGDYPRDQTLIEHAKQHGLADMMFDPDRQLGLPILHFQLVCAQYGVLLKLRVHGTCNDRCSLTMIGAASILPKKYEEFYKYTIKVFPELDAILPLAPDIFEATKTRGELKALEKRLCQTRQSGQVRCQSSQMRW